MPQNKRESLIYTVLMCFCMVLWMSMYNVTLHMGGFSMEVLKEGWLGFPIAYVFAMCCDWFLVSGLAKKFAFTYLVKPEDSVLKKVICVSCSMVVPMVLIMSMYGASAPCNAGHTDECSRCHLYPRLHSRYTIRQTDSESPVPRYGCSAVRFHVSPRGFSPPHVPDHPDRSQHAE